MLAASELAEVRAQAEAAFDQTCTIQSYVETNVKGSVSKAWSNAHENIGCRLAALKRGREYVTAEGLTAVANYVLTVAWDQAINSVDRVIVSGDTYDILAVEDDHSYRTARRVYLAKRE